MNTIELELVPGRYETCRVLREVWLKNGFVELLVLIPTDNCLEYIYINPR